MKYEALYIIIPTLNNEKQLPELLDSLRLQNYPRNVSVIISDGGSTDKTRKIAMKYKCKIINNPRRLAEFGVSVALNQINSGFAVIMACDNKFQDSSALKKLAFPLMVDSNIFVTYPKQTATIRDTWVTRYINMFTDPINHFVYGYAGNARTFKYCYPVITSNEQYTIFDFQNRDYPLIALAQGTMLRVNPVWVSDKGDDISPIIDAIQKGYKFAYVPDVLIEHHTIQSFLQYIKKQKWSFQNYFMGRNYGLGTRVHKTRVNRRIRLYIWPIYSASFIFPVLRAIIGLLIERKKEWIYHPILTYASLYALISEYFRINILKQKPGFERNV